jgi:CubicO group peptidase (beta-lactamase class C family)
VPATPVDYSCFAGASGFVSTPSDLVRFGLALTSGRLLKRETVRTLQTPQTLSSGTPTAYGLGWMLENVTLAGSPARLAHHSSRTPVGGSTSFVIFPDRGIVVAIMSNLAYAGTKDAALQIAEAFAKR